MGRCTVNEKPIWTIFPAKVGTILRDKCMLLTDEVSCDVVFKINENINLELIRLWLSWLNILFEKLIFIQSK